MVKQPDAATTIRVHAQALSQFDSRHFKFADGDKITSRFRIRGNDEFGPSLGLFNVLHFVKRDSGFHAKRVPIAVLVDIQRGEN